MKKDIIQIIIKVLIYALGLVAAYLGVSTLSSCSSSASVTSSGRSVIVTSDTTIIKHYINSHSKNYLPYD